jgi:hypothetical protein
MATADCERYLSFEAFSRYLAAGLGCPYHTVASATPLITDLGLSEASLLALIVLIKELNPYFELPPDIDTADISIHDIYYWFLAMGPGHVEES